MRMYLLDKKQRVRRWLKDNDFVEAEMTEEINAANQINFSLPLKERVADNIYYVAIPTPRSKQRYLLFKLLSEQVKNDRIEYQGIEEAYDELKQYGYIKDIRPNERTAEEMLKMVLEPTRWSLGDVPETNHQSTNFYYISYLEALQKVVGLFNIELTFEVTIDSKSNKITRRQVNVYKQQGQRTGKRFEYGSNLLTVEQEQNSQELITALVGRGKGEQVSEGHDDTPDGYGRRITFTDVVWSKKNGNPVDKPAGQEYLVDPEATELYGFSDGNPRIGLTVFEDIEDPIELINATWQALQSLKRPKVSFKADVTDVGNLGLGDTVAIIRHDLKIEYFTRVYKVKHNLLDENDNQIELGDDFSGHSITSSIIKVDGIANEAKEVAGHAAIAANGKNNNYYSSVQPLAPIEGDIWYKDLGNGETDMYQYHNGGWVFIQSTRDLHIVENQVKEAQQGLNQAKADIITNKQKADTDIENLNKSIEANKKVADESLQKLNDSVTNLQGQYDNNIVPNLNKVMADASDALQKYISAQNSIADLTKQAQQQGKDIADVSNTVKGLNINYANLAGDVNSTKVDVKGLQTTVGTANGDIAQLKLDAQNLQTMLAGKVDNTTYTNFVNLTNRALNARLTASDLNGYAKTADVQATANGLRVELNSVTDRMNNLRIGSRNLLHDTSDQYKTLINDNGGGWLQKTTASTNMTSVANYHSGDLFTYAATVNNTSSQSVQLEIQQFDQNYNGIVGTQSSPIPVGTKNYRASMNVQLDENTRFVSTWLIFQGGNGAQGEQIQVKDERLVFGTVSNTWSPNPDDTEHSLTGLSARITANSQQFSSYYTKSETDNKADAAKNDAVNTIKNDGNWQGLSNILTNSGFLQTADGFMQKVQQTTIPMFNGGGVNLVQGTAKFNFPLQSNGGVQSLQKYDNETNYIQHTASQPSFIGPWFGTFTPEIGKTYTISADVAGNGYILGDWFRYEGNDSSTLNRVDLTDNWQRISNTIHVNKISGNWVIYAVNSTLLKIKHVKIEEGYVATPWSPSPFDLATQVSFSELSQSLDGLRSTVGSNYGNLQSQISQSSSTVRTELIDKVNGVQNQLTSTADSLSLKITNLKIGARNLLHNTSDQYQTLTGEGWMGVYTSSDEYTSVASYRSGDQFTYAATISNTSDVPVDLQVWRCDQNKNRLTNGMLGISAYVYPGQKDVRVFLTGSIDNNTWYLQSAVYSSGGQSGQHTIQVKDERLVEGAYAGTWSSNPNDVAKNIIDLNATLQGLQSTVSGNYGNLQSQINQTATTLRGEVTDKVNGLQGQITTQANNINLMLGTAGDLSNICRNPTFDNHDGWTDNVHVESNWSEIPTKNCGVLFTRDGYYGKEFTVVPGDRYYTSVFANNQNDGDFVLGLHFKMKDGSDQWLSGSRIGARECRQALGSITVPDNAVTANIWASIQKFNNFGFTRFTNVIVKKNDTLAQINMSAGTTLIQNDKIYMDASSTVFSGNAFIPSAAITSLNADKITTGTLNAANVNIINLNANNITTGTINGQNLKINLNTGEILFQHGKITSTLGTLNIDIDTGIMSVTNVNGAGIYYSNGEMFLNDGPINSWFSNPTYGGIRRSPFGWNGGSNGIQVYSSTGVSLETSNYNGAFANGSIIDSTSAGAGVEIGSDGRIIVNGAGVTSVVGGSQFDTGSMGFKNRAHIWVGSNTNGESGNRIVMDGDYVHIISAYRHTTGDAPNLFVANDGALVRSTSATKYKTNIKRSHSTNYGERLLNLPIATWTDKGQKERYEAGKRHIKPNKYFGMIAEDLADAGLDLLVSRNVNGEIEGIQYERIAPALIPVIKKLKDKVERLEKIINEQ